MTLIAGMCQLAASTYQQHHIDSQLYQSTSTIMAPQPTNHLVISSSSSSYGSAVSENGATNRSNGTILGIDFSSGDEGEKDCHSIYELGSDLDDGAQQQGTSVGRYELRIKGRRPVDTSCDEDEVEYPTLPSAKRRKTTITKGLSKTQPIKSFIPNEIFLKIFSFCQPSFLARSRRVSKAFKALIDDEKLWRSIREYHFPEYPKPIIGMKEWEMWNLYLGVGCMICRAPKVRKSYWEFRVRCCKNCLKQGAIKEYVLLARDGFKAQWRDCLISGTIDSWGNWTKSTFGQSYYQNIWWLEDVKALEMKMRSRNPDSIQQLKDEVLQAAKDIAEVEKFEAELAQEKGKEADLVCCRRQADIRTRCSLIDPPLTEDILCYIPAYQTAITASRPLTDRAWKMLLKKLEAGREDAEKKRAQYEQQIIHGRVQGEKEDAEPGILIKEGQLQAERERTAGVFEMANPAPRARIIMGPSIDQFLAENGGTFEPGSEGSFAVRALNYARSKWPTTEGVYPPLGALLLLWGKLRRFLKKPKKVFVCAFCNQQFGLGGVFDHITMTHPHEMGWSMPVESQGHDSNATSHVSCNLPPGRYWPYQEWPTELPIRGGDDKLLAKRRECAKGIAQENQQIHPVLSSGLDTSPKQPFCGRKASKRYLHDQMGGIISKTTIFGGVVPDSHRLFLWLHLSIASYSRIHKEIPDFFSFAHLADIVQMERNDQMFGALRCGICGAYQTKKRKPFTWLALSSHFGHDHPKLKVPWPEVFVKLPSRADISEFCSTIFDMKTRKQWMELLREADRQLAGMLDDVVQLEEGEICSVGVNGEEGGDDVKNEEENEVMAIEITKERALKRNREIEPIRVQEGGDGLGENDVVEHEKKKIKVESPSLGDVDRFRDTTPLTDADRDIEDLFADARDKESQYSVLGDILRPLI